MTTGACKKCGSAGPVSQRKYCRDCGTKVAKSAGAAWQGMAYLSDIAYGKRMATRIQDYAEVSQASAKRTPNVEPYAAADCIGDPDCRRPATHHGMCSRHYSQSTKGQNA